MNSYEEDREIVGLMKFNLRWLLAPVKPNYAGSWSSTTKSCRLE